MLKTIKLTSFQTGIKYTCKITSEKSLLISTDELKAEATLAWNKDSVDLEINKYISDDLTIKAIESIFCFFPKSAFFISVKSSQFKEREDLSEFISDGKLRISREKFSSLKDIWAKSNDLQLDKIIKTGSVNHPKRAPYKEGELLYNKYYPIIDKTISFRAVDIDKDLEKFHLWHNKSYVSKFWELDKSKEELHEYLENGLKDPHSIPTIIEFNNEPVGYFEFYWVKEDRLGPFYNFGDYDRGFHFLIGETSYLGRENVDTILKATSHYVFINDERTKLLAGEPRSDNRKVISYINHFECWRKEKEFDFPHKRAALLLCDRSIYFEEGHPWI